MKYDMFVSYRRSDRELVASVVRRLEARGVEVWYDAEIEGGADWREKIVEALTESEMLVVFFSEDANNSRQLKKELAIADKLRKPVVPILIEDTQPRGAYLYELADRNWIQAFPDPKEKIDEIVEHLVTLAGKDGLSETVVANDVEKSKKMAPPAMGSGGFAPPPAAPAAPEPEREAEQPLAEAVEEFIEGSNSDARPAPKIARAYVGRVSEAGKPTRKLNNILPFRWIDLVFLVPLVGALIWWLETSDFSANFDTMTEIVLAHGIFVLALVDLYGAVVFTFRYYLRRLGLMQALRSYLISSVILFGALMVVFLICHLGYNMYPNDTPMDVFLVFGTIWLVFATIAFLVYGFLNAHRAIRSFRSNIRKI